VNLKVFDYLVFQFQRNPFSMRDTLTDILASGAAPGAITWLRDTCVSQSEGFEKRPFYYAFSGVSRHFDKKASVNASSEQLDALSSSVPGFTVVGWDEFRLARVILLLVLAEQEKAVFLETLAALLDTADLREQAAIFSAYPLLPHQENLVESAVDGLRSNIVDIFDSIALNNPFPSQYFSDEEWNQMVLKAIFISRPLYQIVGIDQKTNESIANAISDLAHERWAAGRTITPEAWRSVIPFVDADITADLERLTNSDSEADRRAAELVLASDTSTQAWAELGKSLES